MDHSTFKAINDAIAFEAAEYNLYTSMIRHTRSINLQEFFRTLAMQELKHEAMLKEFQRTGDIVQARRAISQRMDNDLKIVDSLSPSDDIGLLREGFALSIENEERAKKRYEDMANRAESEELKEAFISLSQEEKEHEALIRKEFNKLFG